MKTTAYVKSVQPFTNHLGTVTFVKVELATGHRFDCQAKDAPRVGDNFDIEWKPAS